MSQMTNMSRAIYSVGLSSTYYSFINAPGFIMAKQPKNQKKRSFHQEPDLKSLDATFFNAGFLAN